MTSSQSRSQSQPSLEDLQSNTMIAVSAVFLTFASIAVALRVYVRAVMIRSFGWDDRLMLLTLALFAACCAFLIQTAVTEITEGVSDSGVVGTISIYLIAIFGLYILTAIVFKISLAIFFLRIVNQRWQRHVIQATVGIYTLFSVSWLFIAVFQCGNPALYFRNNLLGKCLPFQTVLRPLNYIHGVLNAITDWIFAIVPVFVIHSSQMTRQAKFSVYTLLVLGVLGSLCSLIRLAYIDLLGVGIDKLLLKAPPYGITSVVELGCGITAASMATLRPLFSSFLDKARSGLSSTNGRRWTPKLPHTGASHQFQVQSSASGNKGIFANLADKEKDLGVVTVTTELEVTSNKPASEDTLELSPLPPSIPNQYRGPRGPTRGSQSSTDSLLDVV